MLHLLIADDDDVDLEMLCRLLRQTDLDAEIDEAHSGHDFIDVLHRKQFDCVLLDYYLGDACGIDLVTEVKRTSNQACPVIMITGQSNERCAVDAMRVGVYDYLSKQTLNAKQLTRVVRGGLRWADLEHQHQKALALQAAILRSTPVGIVTTDSIGSILTFNPTAQSMLGYSEQEVLNKHTTPLLFHDDEEISQKAALLSDELQQPVHAGFETLVIKAQKYDKDDNEWSFIRKDFSRFTGCLTVTPLWDSQKNTLGYLFLIDDITRRKQIEYELRLAKEQAESANKSKSEFLANMSHEIRTPMNAVLGMSYLLGKTNLSSEQWKYLAMIESAGKSLLAILNDILDFSKIEAGRLELSPAEFELEEVLRSLATMMAMYSGEKDLELIIGVDRNIPQSLMGDALRLQQILVNLAGNAIKFTQKGEVSVRAEMIAQDMEKVELKFSVHDTGIGLDAEQQGRLFNAFMQADVSMTRRFGGTGLGLAISKRLVQLMGGNIGVESELGQGSTFWFTASFKLVEHSAISVVPDLSFHRLLLVTAQPVTRAYLRASLNRDGREVDDVETVDQAYDAVQQRYMEHKPYEIILIDAAIMAGEEWGKVRQRINEAMMAGEPRVMMIAMASTYDRKMHADEPPSEWIDAIVLKPVTFSSLNDSVLEVLVKWRTGDQVQFNNRDDPFFNQLKNVNILLVEDNDMNQMVASSMLEQTGARVDVVCNGAEAVQRLRERAEHYHIVLMDCQMPVMDGFMATQVIRSDLNLKVPVMAMSAGVMESEREKCIESGMTDFIAKPLDMANMMTVIQRHLTVVPEPFLDASDNKESQSNPNLNNEKILNIDSLWNQIKDPENKKKIWKCVEHVVENNLEPLMNAQKIFKAGNVEEVAHLLHTLRGSMGTLGALTFADSMLILEQAVKNHSDQVDPLFEKAISELNKVVIAAEAWLYTHSEGADEAWLSKKNKETNLTKPKQEHAVHTEKPSRILIVEDDRVVATSLKEQLQSLGYDVCGVVDNGDEALACVSTHQPDMILMDIIINGSMNGIKTAQLINQHFCVPIIFTTAQSDIDVVKQTVQTAPYGYLSKPLNVQNLHASLEVALYKWALDQKMIKLIQWFSSMLRCISEGIIGIDDTGKVDFINAAAESLLGVNAESLKGQKADEVLRVENIKTGQSIIDPILSGIKGNQEFSIKEDGVLITHEGNKKSIALSATPVRSPENRAMGAVIVLHDTVSHRYVEQLKEEFIATVSHELRTPLTAIRGALGMMASGALGELPPKLSLLLTMAINNCERLGRLVEDLLDFERITGNYIHFDIQEHLLISLVEEAVELKKSILHNYDVGINIAACDNALVVCVDGKRLVQSLSYYIDNAAKFSKPGQSVDIRMTQENQYIRVSVVDQGLGIPAHFHNHIFKVFMQADSSSSRQKGGVGLSLSIAKDLVEKMGGRVGFESVEGEGATFYLEFPVA